MSLPVQLQIHVFFSKVQIVMRPSLDGQKQMCQKVVSKRKKRFEIPYSTPLVKLQISVILGT